MKKRPKIKFTKGSPRTPEQVRADNDLARAVLKGEFFDPKLTQLARRHALVEQAARARALEELKSLGEISFSIIVEERGDHFVAYAPQLSLEKRGKTLDEAREKVLSAVHEEVTLDPVGILEAVQAKQRLKETARITL